MGEALGLETLETGEATVLSAPVPMPGPEKFYAPPAAALAFKYLGPLQSCHVAELGFAKPIAPRVASMGAKFHEMARLASCGLEPVEIARRLRLEPETVSILMEAPSFKMVLSQHQRVRDAAFADLTKQINLVAEDALALLHLRIMQGALNDKELVKSVISLLNIDGYVAVQKHLVASGSVDEINRAKKAAMEANRERVLRAGAEPKALPASLDGTYELLALEEKAAA